MKAVAAIAAVLLLAACGGSHKAPTTSGLTDLRSIDQLKSLFNEQSGQPRLILLISPT